MYKKSCSAKLRKRAPGAFWEGTSGRTATAIATGYEDPAPAAYCQEGVSNENSGEEVAGCTWVLEFVEEEIEEEGEQQLQMTRGRWHSIPLDSTGAAPHSSAVWTFSHASYANISIVVCSLCLQHISCTHFGTTFPSRHKNLHHKAAREPHLNDNSRQQEARTPPFPRSSLSTSPPTPQSSSSASTATSALSSDRDKSLTRDLRHLP